MTEEFEKRTQEVLEESAGRLDGRTRSRLTQARHAALAQLAQPARHWWRAYVPAGAAAAVAVLAVVIWSGQPSGHAPTPAVSPTATPIASPTPRQPITRVAMRPFPRRAHSTRSRW